MLLLISLNIRSRHITTRILLLSLDHLLSIKLLLIPQALSLDIILKLLEHHVLFELSKLILYQMNFTIQDFIELLNLIVHNFLEFALKTYQ